jgi:hypothetical protein
MILFQTSLSRSFTLLAAGVTILATSSSCSMKQKMDEMHDATVAVPKKLEKMEQITCVTYRSLRQGDAKASRDRDFADMKNAETIGGKLAEAAQYLQGFEFQIWSPVCQPELKHDILLEQFAREFLAQTRGIATDLSAVSATKQSADMQLLYAFAATLHYENELQKALLSGTEYPVLRPFDILVKGLEIDQKKNQGLLEESEIPPFAAAVGKYPDEAIYLLRLRQNFLMAYAYALADSDEYGNTPGTLAKIVRIVKTDYLNRAWSPKLKNRTPTVIDERITKALEYAEESHNALVKLGLEPMMDGTIAEVWERADFSEFNVRAMAKSQKKSERIFGNSITNLMSVRDRLVTAWKRSEK